MKFNYNEISQLTNIKDYEIEQILDKLIKFDDSDIELQYQNGLYF